MRLSAPERPRGLRSGGPAGAHLAGSGRPCWPDGVLILSALLLVAAGLAYATGAMDAPPSDDHLAPAAQLPTQAQGAILGSVLFLAMSWTPYQNFHRLAGLAYALAGLLLLAAASPLGTSLRGGTECIRWGQMTLIPAIPAQLAILVFVAARLGGWLAAPASPRAAGATFVKVCVPAIVLLFEPNPAGAFVLVTTYGLMAWMAGARRSALLACAALIVPAIVGLGFNPHQMQRLCLFVRGGEYGVPPSLLALGSGGLLGVGFGQGMARGGDLPEARTTLIIASIGEQAGLAGVAVVVLLLALVVARCLRTGLRTQDPFGKLVSVGIGAWIAIHALVNLAVALRLVPTVALPLPLVSHQASGTVALLAALGLVANVGVQSRVIEARRGAPAGRETAATERSDRNPAPLHRPGPRGPGLAGWWYWRPWRRRHQTDCATGSAAPRAGAEDRAVSLYLRADRRIRIAAVVLSVLAALVLARAFQVQVLRHDQYAHIWQQLNRGVQEVEP